MASITVSVVSCTLAWPSRYAEIWLDWRGSGQFERLVDSVGGTYEPAMTSPFRFNFRVPTDATPGPTRLRIGTYTCQGCFRKSTEWSRLNPCRQGEDGTAADLAVQILPPAVTPGGVQLQGRSATTMGASGGCSCNSTHWVERHELERALDEIERLRADLERLRG